MSKPRPNEVNIADVMRLALPLETQMLGGAAQARRPVKWVVVLNSWANLDEQVREGDLVIVPIHLQHQAISSDIGAKIQALAEIGIAGVIIFQELPNESVDSAEVQDLPILLAPSDTVVRTLNQSISSLLIDRQTATSERAMQLYRRLSEMSREGQGLQAMTDVMCNLTGNIVVVQDKRLDIKAVSMPNDTPISRDALEEALQQRDQLPPILRNRKAAARARQSYWQQILPVENMGRLISPIISGDRARGYLSVIGPSLDLLDSLTVEHGAAACALEMAKAKAVSEAKKALRGDFLEGLLAGTLPQREIKRLEGRLDHNTQEPHAVMTVGWKDPENAQSLRRLETTIGWLLTNHTRPALVHIYGGQYICIFQALKDDTDMEPAHELSRRLLEQVNAEYQDTELIGGMSGPAATLSDWPQTYKEALQAMQVAQRLDLTNQIVEFNSLGVYQLLCELEDLSTVQEFTSQIIGPLAEYDEQHRGSLVKTIDAYFAHHGNVSQTAESLFVHRNTLLYRMERIQELTEQDLNNSDMRLALHLALKLWQLRPQKKPVQA